METWFDVPGWPEYRVSSEGRVMNAKRGRALVAWYDAKNPNNYPTVWLYRDGTRHRRYVHILVAAAFIGPKPERLEVNHIDGVKANARAANLEYVTKRENERHKFEVLGHCVNQGHNHGMAKLTEEQVLDIRRQHGAGHTIRELAFAYSVSLPTVSMIVNRRTWRHI